MCMGFHMQDWPEPYIYTVYGRIFGDFPANYTMGPYIWFWPTLFIFESNRC